jgi:glycosyltransferase involved in cell wall biosynthesis
MMNLKRRLIVLVYTLDESDPILSHQIEIIKALKTHFPNITVLAGKVRAHGLDPEIQIIDMKLEEGRKFANAARLIIHFLKVCQIQRNQIMVFSHMTDAYSAILGPITKFLHMQHFLWYAHAHKSIYLKISSFFTTGIISSTKDSCPIDGSKVRLIGQGVNQFDFYPKSRSYVDKVKFLHVGRLDPAKNIHLIIEELIHRRITNPDLQLRFVGAPSTRIAQDYVKKMMAEYNLEIRQGWLQFDGPKKRSELLAILQDSDVFIHAFPGSLDKSLVEATMVELPVVTINESYIREFGRWAEGDEEPTLHTELEGFLAAKPDKIKKTTENRLDIAKSSHTLGSWSNKIANIFESEP